MLVCCGFPSQAGSSLGSELPPTRQDALSYPPKAPGLHLCCLTSSFPVAPAYFRLDLIGWFELHAGSESFTVVRALEVSRQGGKGGMDDWVSSQAETDTQGRRRLGGQH